MTVLDEVNEKEGSFFHRVDGDAWGRYFRATDKIKKFDINTERIYWELG